jgi:hypothetical protein
MTTLFAFLASFVGAWAIFKYIILIDMRIDDNTYKTIYELCKDGRKIMIYEEFVSDNRYPVAYVAFCFLKEVPFFHINHSERLMQAGWSNKDHVTIITTFRWNYKKIRAFLGDKLKELQLCTVGVPIQLMLPYETDKIGSLKIQFNKPVLEESVWEDIEQEVKEVSEGSRKRTGAILYGPPGNGKSFFIKYLATKYRMPLMIFTLNPDWTNHDLLLIFAQIPKRCIVVMEDFDNYFDKRKCIVGTDNKSIKFTFDIILNGLDGSYTTYEQVAFFMTVNDIDKVDHALKNRPSRFKFVREFSNPGVKTAMSLLPEENPSDLEGMNLDQMFMMLEVKKAPLLNCDQDI